MKNWGGRDESFPRADIPRLLGVPVLKRLDLSGTQITDAGLAYLKDFAELETLDVRNTRVTAAGIQGLQKALPRLRITR